MKEIILFIVAILPVYLIGLYIYKKDKDKEDKNLLGKLFIFGVLSCFPAAMLELIFTALFPNVESGNLISLAIYVFIGIALVEEFCKWFMTYKIAYKHKEFNHAYDAIVYAVFVSLGFAALENVLYVMENGIGTGIIRALCAIPGHTCNAIIMGHYLGLSKIASINNNESLRKKNLYLSILIPTITHGIYDYCLFTELVPFVIIFAIFVIVMYIYGIKIVKRTAKIEKNFTENRLNYCPKCGTKSQGNFCIKCGKKLLIDTNS